MELDMWKNNLSGTLPMELALLSDSVSKCPLVSLVIVYDCHTSNVMLRRFCSRNDFWRK